MSGAVPELEAQIALWRSHLGRRQAVHAADIAELEDHLREQIAALTAAGLTPDEAFLVAIRRMGAQDAIAGEFAREHSERLWKQLITPAPAGPAGDAVPKDALVALGLAVLAAALVKAPVLFGLRLETFPDFYLRNAVFFVLPLLTGYFAWRRGVKGVASGVLAAGFAVLATVVNVYPVGPPAADDRPLMGRALSDTGLLMAMHMPVVLWALVGAAYAGGRWRDPAARMNFIRFSGELAIYFALMGLGGGVLIAFTVLMYTAIGIDPGALIVEWILPCGAAGAVLVAAWLVEAKQSVIENLAPVLTRVFTPLFTLLLVAFLGTMALTGRGIDLDRSLLFGFDLLLLLVLGLLLYAISARDPQAGPNGFDLLTLALLVCALAADGVALAAMAGRIGEYGSTPNRIAALGLNLVLLVNLLWSSWLQLRFVLRKGAFAALERWQTAYLPILVVWAAIVAIAFPPLFGFA